MNITRSTKTTIRTTTLNQFNDIKTIQIKTLPIPKPKPNEVLLRVESTNVGVWDPYEREDEFTKMFKTKPRFPYILNSDNTNTVTTINKKVHGLKENDRTYT